MSYYRSPDRRQRRAGVRIVGGSMKLAEAIDRFMAHRKRKKRAQDTVKLYRRQLDHWLEWRQHHNLPPNLPEIILSDFNDFLDYLEHEHIPHANNSHRPAVNRKGMKPRTLASYHRTLLALWNFLEKEEDDHGIPLLTMHQCLFFRNDRIPSPTIPADREERPGITLAEVDQLLAACGNGMDEESARDQAIILLLWESGMRVSELCGLTDKQVDLADRSARIIGKGDEPGYVFWGPRAGAALRRYMLLRRGKEGGSLLRGYSSRNNGEAITPNLVRAMMERLAAEAGVTLPEGSPLHWFRRGFARYCRAEGASREEVQILLRHKRQETTVLYLGNEKEPMRRIHQRVHGPEAYRRLYGKSSEES